MINIVVIFYIYSMNDCVFFKVSEVYESITLERLRTILPQYSRDALERLLVEAGKRGHIHVSTRVISHEIDKGHSTRDDL